jgi:hypothetical protein
VFWGAVVAQAVATPFHLAVAAGLERSAIIEDRWTNELPKGEKRRSVRYYPLDGPSQVEEIEAHDYELLAPGTRVPVHVSPLQTTLGPHPTIYAPLALFPALALGILVTMALVNAHRRTAWHEKPLRETREGRL